MPFVCRYKLSKVKNEQFYSKSAYIYSLSCDPVLPAGVFTGQVRLVA